MPPEKEHLFENDFEILKFKNLPRPAQLAISWYMAVDGEAWADVWGDIEFPHFSNSFGNPDYHSKMRELLEGALPTLVDEYGDMEFGIGNWPTKDIVKSIAHDENIIVDQSVEQTIEGYQPGRELGIALKGYYKSSYPQEDRWPVILSNFDDETLQDGWKRFSLYTHSGYTETPVVFYPEEWHYELLQKRNNGLKP